MVGDGRGPRLARVVALGATLGLALVSGALITPRAQAAVASATSATTPAARLGLAGPSALTLPLVPDGAIHPPDRVPDPLVRTSPKVSTRNSDLVSKNWSGYVERTTTFSGVSATWTVPSVVTSSRTEMVATWIGIGGVNTTQLIQTGTTTVTGSGSTSAYSWYELLPTAAVPLGVVHPGDVMQALIARTGTSWHIRIEDVTLGTTHSGTVSYTAGSASSAEWIAERPAILTGTQIVLTTLANFGSLTFSHLSAQGSDLALATETAVYLANTSKVITAYPGPLHTTTTGSYTDTYGSPLPTVGALAPTTGPPSGGTTVRVEGSFLLPGLVTAVRFGSTAASFSVTGTGVVVATAPAGSPGTVDVTVTTTDGTSATTVADRFTFTPSVPVTPASSSGYDLVGSDGGVFVFRPPASPEGGYYGSLPTLGITPASPIVGMEPTSSGAGYFLVGSDGGVFAFGDATYLGSLPGIGVTPRQPITGIVAANGNRGYFLVGRDGGVYAFGTVQFLGSLPGDGIVASDVIGIAATASGNGYWLVTATGTVYGFGAAKNLGTVRGTSQAVSAISATQTGGGYWITTRSGAVHHFGIAAGYGTLPALGVVPSQPVIGIVRVVGTDGYWLIGSDGGIFSFGAAPYIGSLPALGLHVTDIVGAVPTT